MKTSEQIFSELENGIVSYNDLYEYAMEEFNGVDFYEGVTYSIEYLESLLQVSDLPVSLLEKDEIYLDAKRIASDTELINESLSSFKGLLSQKEFVKLRMLTNLVEMHILGFSFIYRITDGEIKIQF